jgi:hypothetical protein
MEMEVAGLTGVRMVSEADHDAELRDLHGVAAGAGQSPTGEGCIDGAGVARLDPSRACVLEGREVQEGLRFVVARQPPLNRQPKP